MTHSTTIGVIGVGYVGLVSAACFAELGYDVVCRDIDADKVAGLSEGRIPFFEPGLAELVVRNRKRLHFTTDVREVTSRARCVFVCVDTPRMYSGDADLSRVKSVIADLPTEIDDLVLVMKSTVPVGTGRKMRALLDARGLEHVQYVSNPEFLKEGDAVTDFMQPDRVVVGGSDHTAVEAVVALHRPLEAPVMRTDVATAEMIKYASNAFLATKISFINEIANVCEETGADVEVVAEGMGHDRRIGRAFLRAGLGYGGSCFVKDVSALKQVAGNSGYHFQLLNAVHEVNELQKRRLIQKLIKHLGPLNGRTITMLGLSFKPNTDDMRDAPSLVVGSRLLAEGAVVRGHDPIASDKARALMPGVDVMDDVMEAVQGADAVVLVTEWSQYEELHLPDLAAAMRTPVLVDGRNMFSPQLARQAGLIYEGVGRPATLSVSSDSAEPAVASDIATS